MLNYKKILLKDPAKPAFWLMLGFIFKGILFSAVILNHPFHDIQGIWGATQGDDSSYLVPIDNLLQHGIYSPDFRMPGYGIIYLFFRLFFLQAGACNALLILQLILASVSVYYLALTALNIFKNTTVFYITFYLFLICSYPNFFDAYIATESLCTSLLIFCVYLITAYFTKQQSKYLLYAGLLVTWILFIRPVFGGLIVVFGLFILLQKGIEFRIKIKHLFLFLIPFMVCEGSWIYHNFKTHKKLILFTTTGAFYPDSADTYLQPLFEFAQSWGGACSFSSAPIDMDWFQYRYPGMKPITHYDSLPNTIYTSAFNKDSLVRLKRMIIQLQSPTIDTLTAFAYQQELRTKLTQYRRSEEKEKPFTYFVKAPLKMMGVMLYGPVTKNYLNRGQSIPLLGGIIISINYLIYYIILILYIIIIILFIINRLYKNKSLLMVSFIPLYVILIHPFIFRFFDNRFLMPAFPMLILCSAFVLTDLYSKISTTNSRQK